ncbi:hypothetical protein CVT25_001854 [Psilocybe cyanescens]|uniref:G-protein coupled receptors family 1 profile domain-containing protein n=1 Tax=Psilocybe cyanescens TaxID=93625 RepID=A0A409WQD6_PSICY|nr:hypothetical protein CVT25_001854 [Psilocybe cyanescens]
MSTTPPILPISLQESIVSDNLNCTILLSFLMGLYTMVYAGTMYLYRMSSCIQIVAVNADRAAVSQKATNSNHYVVLPTISMLYLLSMSTFIIQWYTLDWAVVINGDTRLSMFLSTLAGGPAWTFVVTDVLFYSVIIVSDGLLVSYISVGNNIAYHPIKIQIWRCYHVWGQSLRVTSLPVVFLLAEFGLFVAGLITSLHVGSVTNPTDAALSGNIQSAQIFVSFGTTIITTCMIAYKIHSSSRLTAPTSKRTFKHIMNVLIGSAAGYSLVILVYAVILVVPASESIQSSLSNVVFYMQIVVTAVGGMAPTIVVGRIALSTSSHSACPPSVNRISDLQFHGERVTNGTLSAWADHSVSAMIRNEGTHRDEEKNIE